MEKQDQTADHEDPPRLHLTRRERSPSPLNAERTEGGKPDSSRLTQNATQMAEETGNHFQVNGFYPPNPGQMSVILLPAVVKPKAFRVYEAGGPSALKTQS